MGPGPARRGARQGEVRRGLPRWRPTQHTLWLSQMASVPVNRKVKYHTSSETVSYLLVILYDRPASNVWRAVPTRLGVAASPGTGCILPSSATDDRDL